MHTNYILYVERQNNPQYTSMVEVARGDEKQITRAFKRLLLEHTQWHTRMLIAIEKEDE